MISAKSLGVFIDGEVLRLSLLSKQFKSVKILDFLTVENFRQKPLPELGKEVSTFLRKNKALQCHSVLLVPRHQIIVRQIELPKEAEANLAKVVEYQLANLLPSQDVSVCYDFSISRQTAESKTLLVTIFFVLKSVLETLLNTCEGIGLRVDRVIPSSVAMANYLLLWRHHFKVTTALLGFVAKGRYELVGLVNQNFEFSREALLQDEEKLPETLKPEMEFFRGQARLPDTAVLDVFMIGDVADEQWQEGADNRFKVHCLSQLQGLGLQIAKADNYRVKVRDQFLATAGALAGLKRRLPVSVNLIPAEKRVSKSKWVLVPTYVLLGINLLLVVALLLRGVLQQQVYSTQLSREVARLEPEVKKIRSVEKQIADLQSRTDFLTTLKKSNSVNLEVLNELSRVLPKNTWVLYLSLKNQDIEFSGASDSAASLLQILDNSPYFKSVEFVAPITRDSSGKEIYRIHMKLESGQPLLPGRAQKN